MEGDNKEGQAHVVDQRIEHESFNEHVKKQEYQRLKFLLEKTTIYSKFLADKLKKNEEEAAAEVNEAQEPVAGKGQGTKKGNQRAAEPEKAPFRQPSLVTGATLRDYQLEGVEWLVSLFENGLNGILADEMGLGKTLQCIAFLAFLREQGIYGPFLVVAPLSTISNWVSEINRFAPKMPALLYHGTQTEREELRRTRLANPGGPKFPIVVTSYEIAMNDRKFLQKHYWKYLIVDEGHRIKNLNCKLIRELKAINTANRLLLTGTPLQNNLAELWSLLNFLLPDIFDDLDSFRSWFDLGDLEDERVRLEDEQELSIISNLHTILKPFLLRRLKADVEHGLPPKKEYLLYCGLSSQQQALYQAILNRRIRQHLDHKEADPVPAVDGPKRRRRTTIKGEFREAESDDSFTLSESSESEALSADDGWNAVSQVITGSRSLQNALMQLRKACNHPYLFEQPIDVASGESIVSEALVETSGKMRILDQLLPALIAGGHRVLIFSQMSRMLDILEDYLSLRALRYCRIDGSVPQTERSQQIAQFNAPSSKIPVFLLTTRAGGLGINLVSADTVIFYDSDWNPQMDLQAQDRAHRIGQTRPVLVYRLAVANSVECRILERATSKRRLEKMVIHEKKFKGRQRYAQEDQRIKLEDLEAILKEQDAVVHGTGEDAHASLSKVELDCLLDRSEVAFSQKDTQTSAFKVLQEIRNEAMDALAH